MSTRDSTTLNLSQPAQFLTGVGPKRAVLLEKLGLRTAADLLFFFPNRYENFAGHSKIHELEIGQNANVVGIVDDIDQSKRDGRHTLYVLLKQGKCYMRGIWFNQEYMLSKFRFGQSVQFRGKVDERGGRLQMSHPNVTWIDDPGLVEVTNMLPVYRLTDGISQRQMRNIIADVVEKYSELVTEAIPTELQQSKHLCEIGDAIRQIHSPKNEAELADARRRLVFQELLILQLALSMRRHQIRNRETAPSLQMTPKIRSRIVNRVPFELRDSQRQVLDEIAADMNQSHPMNRLLHGEVGSGKTVVSACAMMLAVAHSHQAVLMAPTEILATQHLKTLKRLLGGSRVRIELCSGSQPAKKRKEIAAAIEAGDVDIIIGTTAVVESRMNFQNLGLVVIDEQHKFGVRQRAQLKQAGFDPHYLVMTATPIPRTLTMTLFGDLDVSTLTLEAGFRSTVKTYIGQEESREKWWAFFRKKLHEGRQGFVVAPFVDSQDDSKIKSAEEMFEGLCNGPLEAFRLELLHGRQPAEQKQLAMDRFAAGDAQVLVATGVIEVGIDVPNATVMTIESAERFGLSQLHQLRGRVGRGKHAGYVCAFASAGSTEESERLKAFEVTNDGFELARLDLQMRGPGNLLSTRQTGLPPLRIANLVEDDEILMEAREVAQSLVKNDPNLAKPEHERLRRLVLSRYVKALDLSDVG